MTKTAAALRKCNECPREYVVGKGKGGSLARPGEREALPFDGQVGATDNGWFHGAFCSDSCYGAAYYEPPSNY